MKDILTMSSKELGIVPKNYISKQMHNAEKQRWLYSSMVVLYSKHCLNRNMIDMNYQAVLIILLTAITQMTQHPSERHECPANQMSLGPCISGSIEANPMEDTCIFIKQNPYTELFNGIVEWLCPKQLVNCYKIYYQVPMS